MSEQPSINIEALARLDLRPDEILAVTLGTPNLTADQCAEAQEWLTDWFATHGQPVAGVLVLPQGSQLAAVRAPEDASTTGSLPASWGGLNHAEIREALESAADIKHLRSSYGL